MEQSALILFFTLLGGIAGYLAMRLQARAATAVLAERLRLREQQVVTLTQENERLAAERLSDASRLAEANTRLRETTASAEEKLSAAHDLQNRLTASFHALSAEALRSNNQAFLDLANQTLTRFHESARGDLGQLVQPLRSSLDRVDARILDLEKERAGAYAGLTQQVEALMRSQASLQAETANLSQSLRMPAARGRWGEVQLRRVVEMAGMLEHCDFLLQQSVSTEEGALRPDMVVQLPNQRSIVVDSKVSLAAYLEAHEILDEYARRDKLKAHAQQVRNHLTRLSAKTYWDQFPHSPEFVVAFLPGESFFSAALEHDPTLLEFGVDRRVILATPTTLIALLKSVAWGWKQEKVSVNAREIRDLGKALYDRLRTLAEHLNEMQRHLSRSNAAFNRAVGAFESRVMPAARRFDELGAATGDDFATPAPIDVAPRAPQIREYEGERAPVETQDGPTTEIRLPQPYS